MWRLVVVTFGFLGWGFYVLSGGADYTPAVGSRQHAAMQPAPAPQPQPEARPAQAAPAQIAAARPEPAKRTEMPDGVRVVLASAAAGAAPEHPRPAAPVSDAEKRLRLTLASAEDSAAPATMIKAPGVATISADPDKIARLIAAAGTVRATPAAAAEPEIADARDLRLVQPSRVNMRQGPGTGFSVVAKLTRGTEVEVLRDEGEGWVKLRVLETGRVGWMADRLLIAAR